MNRGRTAGTRNVSQGKKLAAAALIASGVPVRQAAEELGIGIGTAHAASKLDLPPRQLKAVQDRIANRLVVASDRFLAHSVERINDLSPYQAMLCAGIAHDHYLRSKQAGQQNQVGSITNILVLIDQRSRGNE